MYKKTVDIYPCSTWRNIGRVKLSFIRLSLSLSLSHSLAHSLYVSSVAFICCRGECWMCGCVFAFLHFVVVIVVVVVEINTNALWWIITFCSFVCFCFHFIVVVVVVFILSFLLFVVLIEKDFKAKENKRKC